MLVTHEVPWVDPITAFTPFAHDPVAALLHSDDEAQESDGARGRWSYIAASPFCTLHVDQNFQVTLDGQTCTEDPFHILNTLIAAHAADSDTAPSPFKGGAVGFLSYEMGGFVEHLPPPKPGATGTLMSFGLYDVIAAFDHHNRKVWIISSGLPETDSGERRTRAVARADWMIDALAETASPPVIQQTSAWARGQSRQDSESTINKAINYIRAGDIFQANITQRFSARKPAQVSSWDLFRKLRGVLPSPFGAYVSGGPKFQLLSASPERFLRVTAEGHVETRPIKGTRPRGDTPEQDKILRAELARSAKDRAENLMIVDLMRNDLSRVCETGSIAVPQCNVVETFAQVNHLVSVVTGQLREDRTAIDLLRSCFPGGSVTGAPKVRAMEIIHELEPAARGAYCGAVAWIGFDGAMDSSIIIRSLVVDGDQVLAHAGGGIVADSDPALEYEEAMVKIRPLLAVLSPSDGPADSL